MTSAQLDQLSIDCIRTVSMDAAQQAKSGHPVTPMGRNQPAGARREDYAKP
jgi:transketolase